MKHLDDEERDRIVILPDEPTSDSQIVLGDQLYQNQDEEDRVFYNMRQSISKNPYKKSFFLNRPLIVSMLLLATFISLTFAPLPSPFIDTYMLKTTSYRQPSAIDQSWTDLFWASNMNLQIYTSENEQEGAVQVERWLHQNIKGNEKIMIVYEDELKMSIIILASILSSYEESIGMMMPPIPVIVKHSELNSPNLNSMILSLLHNRCFSKVHLLFGKEEIDKNWKKTGEYQYIIGGDGLWDRVNEGSVGDLVTQQIGQYASKFTTKYQFPSFIFISNTLPFNTQIRIGLLQNSIEVLSIASHSRGYLLTPLTLPLLQSMQQYRKNTFIIHSQGKKPLGSGLYGGNYLGDKIYKSKSLLAIQQYDCPASKYQPLQTLPPISHYYYHQNPLNVFLLVPAIRLHQYSQHGCLYPGLLRLVVSLKSERPLVISDAIDDDMIYLGMAKSRAKGLQYLVMMPGQKRNVLEREIQDSEVVGAVKFIEVQPIDAMKMKSIYDLIKPDLLLTSYQLFSRDYSSLFQISVSTAPMIVIFLWDKSNPEFLQGLIKTHQTYQLVDLRDNIAKVDGKCLKYGLNLITKNPKEEGWIVVKLGVSKK